MALCDCHTRRAAAKWGAFQFVPRYGAWVFVDDTVTRRVAVPWRVKDKHDGEPYRWVTCPFCGLDLPDCALDPPTDPPDPASFCAED